MAEQSVHVPLLSGKGEGFDYAKKTPFLVSSAKWVLTTAMWVIFISWVTFLFLYPSEFGKELRNKWNHATSKTLFGVTGSIFLLFSGPILIIAFLAVIHLIISGEDEIHEKKKLKKASFRLWTFPVIIDGPFGVVSAAELIGIILFSVFIIWLVSVYTVQNSSILSNIPTFKERSTWMLELSGLRFGMIGLFCLAFLFLPISRGSVLLRLIDIPFEHATRYHVWLGHLTMMIFTLHGLLYVIAWTIEGKLIYELNEWKNIGVANLPGVISLLAGLLMWVTSLPPVRRINFELFFYTHQLYVVFVVFLALHVGDFIFSIAAAGIFLFMLDRFLRFCQSRNTVDILSARCLPCGTVELVVSKPASLRYNALSWIFLQVRELSWLQWHPFSVSSSPLDGKYHLAILIKVLGDWTEKLRGHIVNSEEAIRKELLLFPHSKIKASVEGPYGHESPYHLTHSQISDLRRKLASTTSLIHSLLTELARLRESSTTNPNTEFMNLSDEAKLAIAPHKLPLGFSPRIGSDNVHPPVGSGCMRFPQELTQYMTYDIGGDCPVDDVFAQKFMLKGCEPLPRRRCHPKSPSGYMEPTRIPESLWATPPDSSIIWDPYTCKNYKCLVDRKKAPGYHDCKDCFDLKGREKTRWLIDNGGLDYGMDQVLSTKPRGTIRIGLDIGGGTGTFAARMQERNITIITSTMNLDGPFNSFIASRGLIPIHVSVFQRLPFFENTLDIVHSMHVLSNWIPDTMLQFTLYDIYRVLRPGGLFWLDHFFCLGTQLNATYVPLLDRVGFKKLRWNAGMKLDRGADINEWYFSALLEKPMT